MEEKPDPFVAQLQRMGLLPSDATEETARAALGVSKDDLRRARESIDRAMALIEERDPR
jgi:hypothetical protein